MKFIVVFIALLTERFFDWSHMRKWNWYLSLESTLAAKMPQATPTVLVAAMVLPLAILSKFIESMFGNTEFGIPLMVFELVGFIYCLGPQNLWADTFSSINAMTKDTAEVAADKLKAVFNLGTVNVAEPLHRQLLTQIFISANQRVFAVIFWFVALGLPGAVLYRLVNLLAAKSPTPAVSAAANKVEMALDWMPARIMTFMFALGGNYNRVFVIWRKYVLQGLESSDLLVAECGMAAINDATGNEPDDGAIERGTVSLLDRVFLIVLVMLMVLVFIL